MAVIPGVSVVPAHRLSPSGGRQGLRGPVPGGGRLPALEEGDPLELCRLDDEALAISREAACLQPVLTCLHLFTTCFSSTTA